MSEYRDDCIKHKLVQRGIVDQRKVTTPKKKVDCEWLTVYWHNTDTKWKIWNRTGYKLETDARKVMEKMLRYWPLWVVHRSIFESHYKPKGE